VSTFCTLIHDIHPGKPAYSAGVGTHFSSEIALLRSITEACLDRAYYTFWFDKVKEADVEAFPAHLRWEARVYRERTLGGPLYRTDYYRCAGEEQDFRSVPSTSFDDVGEAIREGIRRLRDAGVRRLYIADHTRYAVPVVKVIAPELEFAAQVLYGHRDPQKGLERRLHAVPARLGYRENTDYHPFAGIETDLLL
jgi:ribosomal protein S12 methylthiotransferase accessory factor YcaO